MSLLFNVSALNGKTVHLGVSGSIAAYKALDLLRSLVKSDLLVSATLTESASRFVTGLSFSSLGADPVYGSMFDNRTAGPFEHLDPGAEADAFVIAPASAQTMARLATGMADEMLSAQALAYPGPIIIAPAMNPRMWANSATRANLATLQSRGHVIVSPDSGLVACNEEGQGKLADLKEIYLAVLKALSPQDMSGLKVMITLGPTREPWDSVRFWSNHSTGRMGSALALAAYLRGAEVHAICGPGSPWLPSGVKRTDVVTAVDMHNAATALWNGMDLGIFTAAVADFAPEPHTGGKFKKSGHQDLTVSFKPNPDILATLGKIKKSGQRIIGFAAESGNLEEAVREKLQRKNADLLVGNLVGKADSGFAGSNNTVFIADAKGREEHWPTLSKNEVAWRALDWLSQY